MALASSRTISIGLAASQREQQPLRHIVAPPGLLRCLVVSWSEQRAELFRSAAESEDWQALVCRDVGQFMRSVFRLKFPLTLVDLPRPDAVGYAELREATVRSREMSDSLLVTSVAQSNAADELWARELGVWTHLPEASSAAGLAMVFREAREALAKQAVRSMELNSTESASGSSCRHESVNRPRGKQLNAGSDQKHKRVKGQNANQHQSFKPR